MGKLDGKVAVVTGASRGIGRGIASLFARQGASLVVTARSESALAAVSRDLTQCGADNAYLAGDIADAAHVAALFELLDQRFGRIDVLVNNAGAFDGGPIDELSLDAWDRVIATNLRGPFLGTQAALRRMKRQQDWGSASKDPTHEE